MTLEEKIEQRWREREKEWRQKNQHEMERERASRLAPLLAEARTLRRMNLSLREIGRRMGYSRESVRRFLISDGKPRSGRT